MPQSGNFRHLEALNGALGQCMVEETNSLKSKTSEATQGRSETTTLG